MSFNSFYEFFREEIEGYYLEKNIQSHRMDLTRLTCEKTWKYQQERINQINRNFNLEVSKRDSKIKELLIENKKLRRILSNNVLSISDRLNK